MDDIDYNSILNNFLMTIFLVANKDLQRKAWIQGIGPGCYDFNENMLDFLNYYEWILEKPEKYNINDYQIKLIKLFQNEYEAFYDNQNPDCLLPEKFIDSPRWTRVTEIAKRVLEAFNYKPID